MRRCRRTGHNWRALEQAIQQRMLNSKAANGTTSCYVNTEAVLWKAGWRLAPDMTPHC